MSDSYEVEKNGIDGEDKMGSLNHGMAQTKLNYLLLRENKNLTVISELSLDISQHDLSQYRLEGKYELKSDVCAYLEPPIIPDTEDDLVTVSKIPDLIIEILSPRQAVSYLIRKINAFFELGTKSCWLVNPSMQIITVYSQPNQRETFVSKKEAEVIDEVMNIHLPIQEIFS
ncbi:MAG: Uma2 family endonuclease [Thiomargarita sp.]|nr:Uma2 family endonuclease [Thiomargarita sp.]